MHRLDHTPGNFGRAELGGDVLRELDLRVFRKDPLQHAVVDLVEVAGDGSGKLDQASD